MFTMIWLIVFVFICGQIEQFNCASESTDRKINFDEQSEYDILYCYELTPSSLDASQLIHPVINDSTGTLKRSNITEDQPGIPFHLIIRLVDARTSKPLVGAYIYVWHVNIYGNYSGQNDVRRFRRSAPFEEFHGEENHPHDRPWEFDHESDHGPHSRQGPGRGPRLFPPPDESKFNETFDQFDGPRSPEPEFHGLPYDQTWSDFNEFYGNHSIWDSKISANRTYSSNDSKLNETTTKSQDSENFTNETITWAPFIPESFTNATNVESRNLENSTNSVTYEPTFNNLTKVDNVTSKDNHTIETRVFDQFNGSVTETYSSNDTSFITESFTYEPTSKSRDSENFTYSVFNETITYPRDPFITESVTETYLYNDSLFTTESATYEPTFSNLTKVNNLTSEDNHTIETHEQKHYANEAQTHFLQGYQITDFKGDVSFVTIVPGWIANRSLHVNVHVYLDQSQETATFVGQLYFPNEFADKLRSVPMYSQANLENLTNNHQDEIFKLNNGNSTMLTLETIGSGYQSIITLGIDPLKTIKP